MHPQSMGACTREVWAHAPAKYGRMPKVSFADFGRRVSASLPKHRTVKAKVNRMSYKKIYFLVYFLITSFALRAKHRTRKPPYILYGAETSGKQDVCPG